MYNLFIYFYRTAIGLAGRLGNKKAQAWTDGRLVLFDDLNNSVRSANAYIWVHCASAGELEQGKPVIEKLKETNPRYKILISFFSPSGYKAGKKYASADVISYLPVDTKQNAEKFLQIVQPHLVVFVKYEYWYHHLKAVRERNIPLLLVSALFRKEQVFFRWYGTFYKKLLHLFTCIFVQDESSCQLLQAHGIRHCRVAGDTRFDRVLTVTSRSEPVAYIDELFNNNKPLLVAGSTWPEDEQLLAGLAAGFNNLQFIIAPHEITPEHIRNLQHLFPQALLYSQLPERIRSIEVDKAFYDQNRNNNMPVVLIIDNVGMLSRLYQYATIAYVGGGFKKSGIHNTLEAAVWGKPVLFGPNYQKFKEARDLIAARGAFSFRTAPELKEIVQRLLNDTTVPQLAGTAAKDYVQQNKGATQKIMHYIQENRLLTS